jgi:voltage-gated potassium channel
MSIIFMFRRLMDSIINKTGYRILLPAMLGHLVLTYLFLMAAGETAIVEDLVTFTYWYYTTTTTVGFGDITPKTEAGKLITALWVMAGGIILVTGLIGSATSTLMNIWRNRVKGNVNLGTLSGHTVLVGWNGEQSERMIGLLIAEHSGTSEKMVLCDDSLDENPKSDHLLFVSGESLTNPTVLGRAGVAGAARIIVTGRSDDHTLAIVLAVNSIEHQAHMVAHFSNSQTAALAKRYVPCLEVASAMTMEMLVRSARDPGTSDIIYDLLSINKGVTLFTQKIQPGFLKTYNEIATRLMYSYQGTLIGYRKKGEIGKVSPGNCHLQEGDEIYYIAPTRLANEAFK